MSMNNWNSKLKTQILFTLAPKNEILRHKFKCIYTNLNHIHIYMIFISKTIKHLFQKAK